MKKLLIVCVTAIVLVAGCQALAKQLINSALKSNYFYKALSMIDKLFAGYVYVIPSGGVDSPTMPVTAWRNASHAASIESVIDRHPFNDVHVAATAQDTLVVVYLDGADTAKRDTVYKPTPVMHASVHLTFELVGDSWKFRTMTKGVVRSDSALSHIDFDSMKVAAWRSGAQVNYPLLTQASAAMPYDTFLFQVGDSVTMDVWLASDLQLPWAFGRVDTNVHMGFQRDASNPKHFYGFWQPTAAGRHVVWCEAIGAYEAFYSTTGPDRSVMWGMPCRVQ